MPETAPGIPPPTRPALACLHIWLATTLVVVHPVLDVLARHPEFFPTQRLGYGGAVLVALGLELLVPLPLVLLRLAMGRRRLAETFDAAVIGVTLAIFFFQASRTSLLAPLGPPWLALVAAVVAGTFFVLWRRMALLRTYFTFLAPALVVVPAVYFLHPAVLALRLEPDRPTPLAADAVADVPVVVVVFDALSASAVMRADRRVNEIRFPHLAALADDSLWFTEAVTVASWTNSALPAVVTGRYPEADLIPGWRHYPENLFAALADSHRIVAVEPMFRHCRPEWNQRNQPPDRLLDRVASLAGDLGVLFLHRTLPSSLTRSLPSIDQGWGGFVRRNEHRTASLYELLDAMQPGAEPTLYYAHVVFPHMPYLLLPSGKVFRTRPEPHPTFSVLHSDEGPNLETQVFLYKRYLFQAGHVDRLVADLVRRLREVGRYDRSLIVLTSDHGGRTGPRVDGNDVVSIPLLIKLPHSSVTGVRTRRASNLDVVPTILDVVDAPEPWPLDGRSVLSPDHRPPEFFFDQKQRRPATAGFWSSSQPIVEWKIEHFGLGDDPLSLYRAGSPRPDLLGLSLDRFEIAPAPDWSAKVDEGGPILEVDPQSSYVPVLLRGSLFFDGRPPQPDELPQVAVSLNGTVEAVVTVRLHEAPGWYRFRLTIPEASYRPGANEVRVWKVDPTSPRRLLGPL